MSSVGHNGVSIPSEATSDVKMKKIKCKEHDKKIKLFCGDCKKTLCTVCCCTEHRSCKKVVTIQEMLPEVKQTMLDRLKRITEDANKTSQLLLEHETELDKIAVKTTQLKTEIQHTFQDAESLLQHKENQLLKKVDDITNKQREKLNATIKSDRLKIRMYSQQYLAIQKALTFEDETHLFGMYLSSETETEMHSEAMKDIADIRFTHNMEKLRENIDMMDVYDGVVHLRASYELIETKMQDQSGIDLCDVVILTMNGINSVVVTDFSNTSIKSNYVKNLKIYSSQLKTNCFPWSLAILNQTRVMVSVPRAKQILTVGANPDLTLLSTITTNKEYYGLAVLDQSTLVAGSCSSVDVLEMTGNVLRSFTTLPSIQKSIQDPYYLHVTNQGNILVSDWGLKSIICLTSKGEVVFDYSPTGDRILEDPHGITTTINGGILLADSYSHKVIHLTQSGEFVQDILTSRNGLQYPVGLCVDEDKLYVATLYKGVHVYTIW